MWVSNLRLVSNLSVNIIPPNSKREKERDTVSEKYVNMFFPKISVFPVSSEARNTTSAAFQYFSTSWPGLDQNTAEQK